MPDRAYSTDEIFAQLLPLLEDKPDFSCLSDENCWTRVREMAVSGGVAALLAFRLRPHLNRTEEGRAQQEWCDRILSRSLAAHRRSLAELESVVSSFAAEGIEVIPLKGPLLAERHYKPAFTRRPAADLDVLVRNGDLRRATGILEKQGFAAAGSIAESRATHYHVVMRSHSRLPVEVHFRLGHGARRFDAEQFFERGVRMALPSSGIAIMALSPADELLHLALHLVSDRFRKLAHFVELRMIWKKARPEWREEAIDRAMKRRLNAVVSLLDVAFRLRWNEPFIPVGMSLRQPWAGRRVDASLYKALEAWRDESSVSTLEERLRGRLLEIQLTDTVPDALAACWETAKVAWPGLRRGRWGKIHHGAITQK